MRLSGSQFLIGLLHILFFPNTVVFRAFLYTEKSSAQILDLDDSNLINLDFYL